MRAIFLEVSALEWSPNCVLLSRADGQLSKCDSAATE